MGLPAEASYFLDRTEGIIQETSAAYTAMRAYLLERPLQFRFSEKIYSRPDIPKYPPGSFSSSS